MRTVVAEHNLIRRINRVLSKEGQRLAKSRKHELQDLGRYHVVGINNIVVDHRIEDLEGMARKIGAIGDHEKMSTNVD